MTRRAAIIVVSLVVAALVGVGLLAIPGSPFEQRPTLGLDLQGGLEVTLQAVPPRDRELTKEDLDRSVSIMRDRVDKLGVSEPEIRTQGDDQISIQLPGVKDPAAAAAIIGKTAQLELFDLQANLVAPSIDARTRQPIATPKLYDLLAGQQSLAEKGEPDTYYVFETKGKKLVRRARELEGGCAREVGRQAAAGHKLFAVPPDTVVVSCGIGEESCPGVGELNPTSNNWYLFRYTPPEVPEMTGEDLDLSGTRQDFDTRTGEPIVLMDFTDAGSDKFEDITREIAQRGKLLFNTVGGGQGDYQNWLQSFAIVLDREIKSYPTIDFEEYPGGITGSNGAQISGIGDIGDAKDLALVLQTGALPVEFRTLDQTAISATLGKDSLEEAKTAALVGLLAVAIFLLIFYRFLGVVAVVGLGDLRGDPLRRDPHLQRHDDAPGHRGPRPDARRRSGREHRHLRTHQGRGARRQIRACGHPDGLHEGLRDHRRRQRRHHDHGTGAVRGRDGERARLRVDAPRRYGDLDADGGRRDAGAPRRPRRHEAARQPPGDGRRRRRIPRWLRLDYIGQRNTWFAISGVLSWSSHRRDRDQGPEPRNRLQGWHADRVRDAARRSRSTRCAPRRRGSARRARRSRVAAPRPGETRTAASPFAPSR